jgi:hypothetical protein
MRSAKEYRENAAECRRIALTMKGEDKQKLLNMAELWEKQAQEADKKKD